MALFDSIGRIPKDGFPLIQLNQSYGCLPRFYCPNIVRNVRDTYPQAYLEQPICRIVRLGSATCEPQGPYEPLPCPAGSYCPTFKMKEPCPSGYYCPIGSMMPKQCSALAYCPPESKFATDYTGMLIFLLVDLLLLVWHVWTWWRRKQLLAKERTIVRTISFEHVLTTPTTATNEVATDYLMDLLAGYYRAFVAPLSSNASGAPAIAGESTTKLTSNLASTSSHGTDMSRFPRMNFSFEELRYDLPDGKTILKGVSGHIRSGRLTCVMGPSGSGKTTFMNVLAGKLRRTNGSLLINGQELEMHRFRKIIGHVPQSDIMIPELTIRETLMHSASTLLPRTWTKAQIETHVSAIIKTLGLEHVEHSFVGDERVRGISGGQKKRCNIGVAMTSAPLTIFLDEPTSGLDSSAALAVVDTLKRVASIGVTVVAVLHQPRYEIFEKFDDILLLAPGGKSIYFGPQSEIVNYFKGLGYEFKAFQNPADILLDIMNQKKRKLARGYSADELSSMWDNKNDKDGSSVPAAASLQATVADPSLTRPLRIMTIEEPEKKPAVKGTAHAQSVIQEQAMAELKSRLGAAPFTLDSPLGDTMRNSPVLDDRMLSDDEDLADAMPEPVSPLADPPAAPEVDTLGVLSNHAVMHHRRNSRRISQEIAKESLAISIEELPTSRKIAPVWRQFLLCTKRSLIQQQRTQISFLLEIFVSIIASMAIGAAVMGLDGELFRGYFIQPYTILSSAPMTSLLPLVGLLIGVCASISAAPAAVKVFGEEQTYWKDMAAGHSRMAYFFSKMVTSTLRLLITSIHFAGVLYIMGKFSTSFSDFYAIVMLIFFCAYGVSFVVSLLVRRENGTLLAVMVCLVFSILNGFGPSYYLVKKWGLQWLWGMSYGLWATEALYGLETRQYEDLYDIPMSQYSFSFELWRHDTDINALIAIGMVFRVLTYLLLRFKNRDKQM